MRAVVEVLHGVLVQVRVGPDREHPVDEAANVVDALGIFPCVEAHREKPMMCASRAW